MLIVFLLFSWALSGTAGATPDKKVVVVIIDGLWQGGITPELAPNLTRLQALGAVGVMNHNSLGAKTEVNAYLTIGAGSKASAPFTRVRAFEIDEAFGEDLQQATGRDLYVRHFGVEPQGALVVPQMPQMKRAAEQANYRLQPGLLGDAVHDLDGRTAVLGNSDQGRNPHRPAALIAMDGTGIVDSGSFRTAQVQDETRPYGVRTDMQALYQEFLKVQKQAELIVLDIGDTSRLHAVKDVITTEQMERAYQAALQDADRLIGDLLPHVGADLMLAVISPLKNQLPDAATLSPVLIAGGDIAPGSLLTSGTTKRAGLIANYDLAPTFVQMLGGDPLEYHFLGQPITAIEMAPGEAMAQLDQIVADMLLPSGVRSLLIKPWLNVWIGVAGVILLGTIFRQTWLHLLTPLAELLLLFPLVWLYVPLFNPATRQDIMLYSVVLALTAWGGMRLIAQPLLRCGLLASLVVLTLLGDMLLGAPLMKESVFSYDPVVGARYYGIGNEYMGLLLGAALLLLNVLLAVRPRHMKLYTLLLFFAIVWLFAAPSFGTNAGGAIAAAVGGVYTFLQLSPVKMTLRRWLWLACGALSGVGLLFALNLGGEQTHIGRAAELLIGGHYGEVLQIAVRKMELNLHLLRVSAWGKLLILFSAILLVWRMRGAKTPFLLHNFKTQIVTAGAAFLVNDSGVVAAAIILLFAVVPLLSIREQNLDILPTEQQAPQEWTTR